jgi:MSHA pilin protein MshC
MSLFHKKTSDNKGFTLIEVIAVLIILGILVAIAVSRVGSNQNDLIPQADTVKSHLRFAQLKALADESTWNSTWGIAFTGDSYTLQNNGGTASINLPGENGKIHTFPSGSGITVTSTTVTFDSWGSPATDIDITVTQGGASKRFRVHANTGYIEDI